MKNKYLVICISLITLSTLVLACNKSDENLPIENAEPAAKLATPELNLNKSSITLLPNQDNDTALMVSWTASSADANVEKSYALYLNIDGEDLFKGYNISLGDTLKKTFSNNELNQVLLKDLGVKMGDNVKLNIAVYAKATDKSVDPVLSTIKSFTVSTFIPQTLYLIGGAYDPSWDISKAVKLAQKTKGVYEAANVQLKFGNPDDGLGFKFLLSGDNWSPFIGKDRNSSSMQKVALYYDGDSQFYPLLNGYTDGVYTITVDVNTLTLTLKKTGDVLPDALYLIGGAYDLNWDINNAAKLSSIAIGIYQAVNIPLDFGALSDGKGFKFLLSKANWSPFIGHNKQSSSFYSLAQYSDGDSQIYPLEHGFTSGLYTIKVDLNNWTLELTRTAALPLPIDYKKALFMLGDGTPFGWSFDKANAMSQIAPGEYEYSNVYLSGEQWKGFKFFVGYNDWSFFYGRVDPKSLNPYWTLELKPSSGSDAQYYLYEAGMASGNYKIHLSTNNMSISLTKL